MQENELINNFGKEVYQNFWIFVENLKFDSKKQDAFSVRKSILTKLSPSLADKYKELCDELAFSLYRSVFYDKKNIYLYAAFEAISKGREFYQKCWEQPNIIEPFIESLDQFNNFSTVLPTEDDYFNVNTPSPNDVLEDYDEYLDYISSLNSKKPNRKKNKNNTEDFED
jgi:hypothetical protein